MHTETTTIIIALCLSCSLGSLSLRAQTNTSAVVVEKPADDQAELAKKLSNPVAALISVPLQNNFDFGAGPNGDGFQYKLNIQPVVPISLSKDWNIISRTILPYIYQDDVIGTSSQSGLGDTTQPHLQPMFDPVAQIVYAAKASDVRTTVVNGRVLMHDRQVRTLDRRTVLADAAKMAARVKAAVANQ